MLSEGSEPDRGSAFGDALSQSDVLSNVKCMFCKNSITCMQLDLNLLSALDILIEEGSVGRAAARLHLSQPAMSRTLGRIRRATGDQILVRSGREMLPTPYALRVRDDVHELVQQIQAVLSPERELDLATLERTFTLRCHDAVTNALAPGLLASARDSAPGVLLRFLAEGSGDSDGLRTGSTDLEIGSAEAVTPDVRSEVIATDRLVVAVRPDHPLAQHRLTLAAYAAAEHVTVSRRGRLVDPVDETLAGLGRSRRVVGSAPTSTAALHIARSTDVLVAVPEKVCRADIDALGLVTLPIPLDLPAVSVILLWHQRHDGDAAHTWLRGVVRQVLTSR